MPKIVGFNIKKRDHHKLWAHALAIYGFSKTAFNLKTSNLRPEIPILFGTPVLNVSAYVHKLPYVVGDDISKLDTNLAKALLARAMPLALPGFA